MKHHRKPNEKHFLIEILQYHCHGMYSHSLFLFAYLSVRLNCLFYLFIFIAAVTGRECVMRIYDGESHFKFDSLNSLSCFVSKFDLNASTENRMKSNSCENTFEVRAFGSIEFCIQYVQTLSTL